MWNTNKSGGWSLYKNLTEDDDKFRNAVEHDNDDENVNSEGSLTTTEAMVNIEKNHEQS